MKKTNLLTICVASAALLIAPGLYANNADEVKNDLINLSEDTSNSMNDAKDGAKVYLSDAEITAKVKEKFISEKLFDKTDVAAFRIHVKTTHGVVHLSGKVKEKTQEDNAISIAKSIEGVKEVISTVKVKAPANPQK